MMNDPTFPSSENTPLRSLLDRLLPVLAWVVVAALVLARLVGSTETTESPPDPAQQRQADRLVDTVLMLQTKVLLAASRLTEDAGPDESEAFTAQLRPLETGSVRQRQQIIVVTGVIAGNPAAQEALDRFQRTVADSRRTLSPAEKTIDGLLRRIFSAHGGHLSSADSQLLEAGLGWFGTLAVNATQTDRQSQWKSILESSSTLLVVVSVTLLAAAILLVMGIAGLITGIVLAIRKRLRTLPVSIIQSGVWIETFAVWLLMFMLLLENVPKWISGLAGLPVAFLLSLIALGWLPLRGVPVRTAIHDVGWHRGRGWCREIGAGVAGYVMMLPILGVGVLGTLGLMLVATWLAERDPNSFQVDTGAAHPIFAALPNANTGQLLMVFILAAVVAPLVEEMMFRGVLYRYLRDSTRRGAAGLSIAFAGLFSGFIFAAVHPQGWVAIPAIGSIGLALALAREWRSSLIAPTIMHGISNGLVLSLVFLALKT